MNNTNNTCSICLEDIIDKNICLLNCNHPFCKKCIDDYLKLNNTNCPNCRQDISSYQFNNINYQLIFINDEENNNQNQEISLLRNQLHIFNTSNRKLVQYGYITLASLFYFVYNYFSINYHYQQLQSNYTNAQTLLNECYYNQTELYNLLNDESRNIIIFNPNYDLGQKCLLSEYSYQKCFQHNIYN